MSSIFSGFLWRYSHKVQFFVRYTLVPQKADGLKEHRCLILEEGARPFHASLYHDYDHTFLWAWCISTTWKLIDCTENFPDGDAVYIRLHKHILSPREPVINRTVRRLDWLSEIHLKLWIIPSCYLQSSTLLSTTEHNVMHLYASSSLFWCTFAAPTCS